MSGTAENSKDVETALSDRISSGKREQGHRGARERGAGEREAEGRKHRVAGGLHWKEGGKSALGCQGVLPFDMIQGGVGSELKGSGWGRVRES
eukprot:758857-Hanusia_phi.AAC.3